MLGLLAPPTRPRAPGLLATPVDWQAGTGVFDYPGLDLEYRGDPSVTYGRSATNNARPFEGIVFHHTAAGTTLDDMVNYGQTFDPGRGGTFGYHFYVGPNGEVVQGAPLEARTNHIKPGSPTGLSNSNAVGISLVGGEDGGTEAQRAAAANLADTLRAAYDIDVAYGHGELQNDRMESEGLDLAQAFRGGTAPPPVTPSAPAQSPTMLASAPQAPSPSGAANTPTLTGNAGQDTLQGGSMPQGLLSGPPQETRRPSIWDRVPGLGDPQRRARLAMAIEGMMLNPNQAIVQTAQDDLEAAREEERINRTAQWLRSQPGGGQFADAILAGMDANDVYGAYAESQRPPAPVEPMEVNGQLVNPQTGAVIGDYRTPEAPEPTQRLITGEDILRAYPQAQVDPSAMYNATIGPDGTIMEIDAAQSGPLVENNIGEGESAFSEETGKLMAQEAAGIVDQASTAQQTLARLNALESALAEAPTGASGALTQFAGNLGIEVEGTGPAQAATAIINQLVPTQRPPGSGQMSDRDVELFRQSVPRLVNTPEGNRMIISTMRAIADYDVKRGEIARRLQLGQITPQQADQEYRALGNPIPQEILDGSLTGAGDAQGGTQGVATQAPQSGSQPQVPQAGPDVISRVPQMSYDELNALVAPYGNVQDVPQELRRAIVARATELDRSGS